MKKTTKHVQHEQPRRESPAEGFRIDDESSSLAEELISSATSAESAFEDARNEAFLEETTPLYNVDFTVLDDEDKPRERARPR